jgi:hypothetical protein
MCRRADPSTPDCRCGAVRAAPHRWSCRPARLAQRSRVCEL